MFLCLGHEDDHIFRAMVSVWTIVGLAWFAGIINNIQSKFGERVERHKVGANMP